MKVKLVAAGDNTRGGVGWLRSGRDVTKIILSQMRRVRPLPIAHAELMTRMRYLSDIRHSEAPFRPSYAVAGVVTCD